MSDNFFLDVFNKLLKINDDSIMIIFDVNGNIWFKFRDLLKALGYASIDHIMKDIKISINNKKHYSDLPDLQSTAGLNNIQKTTIFINEPGLYELLSVSTKPLAKVFMKKYYTEIMPKIRQSGTFTVNEKEKEKINELNNKIDKLKEKVSNLSDENNFLDSKHRFQESSKGYAYINQTTCIHKGIKTKCYKFGISTNMKIRTGSYKTGNPTYKLLYYIPLEIDIHQLEGCINDILKPHQTKKNNETLSFLSLKELKDTINICTQIIANHICHCVYCKKKMGFNKIDKHKCKDLSNLEYISPKKPSKKTSKKTSKKSSRKSSKKPSKKLSKKLSKKTSKQTSIKRAKSKSNNNLGRPKKI